MKRTLMCLAVLANMSGATFVILKAQAACLCARWRPPGWSATP